MSFGPPNVSQMLFQGIGGLGTMFQQGFDGAVKRQREQQRQGLLSELGASLGQENADFRSAAARALALGDADLGLGLLKLGETAAERRANQEALRNSPFSTGGGQQTNQGGGPNVTAADGGEVQSRFVAGVRQAGLTNPYGLAAVVATGQRESGFSPGNQNRTWSDPSESGQAGTSGGLMSWRGPRLQALQNFARQRGEQGLGSPETQAAFMAQEDPTLISRLNAARSPQEANQIMANAWRFAGFNRPGGELAAREALTNQFATRFKGQGGQQVAAVPQRQTPGVQVAMTEEDVQRLEAQMPGYGGAPQPVQMAQGVRPIPGDDPVRLRQEAAAYDATNPEAARQMRARADMAERGGAQMAQGGQSAADVPTGAPAQFAAPGASQGRGGAMPPNDPRPDITDQQLMGVLANPRLQQQHAIAKTILDNRMRWRAEGGQLREEGQRLQNQKLQRELDNRFEPLTTPEARRAAGIPDEDKRPYQINRATNELKVVGGSQVTVNNRNEGAIPSGYRAVRDAQGNIERLEPIPGSKAEQEARDLAAKKAKADAMRGETGNTVANALDDIDRLSREAFFPVAGPVGSRLAQFSGTAAHDVKQAITTIAANISFDKLQQMREASPTGGALGAVTERELELLKNSAASLEQSQTPQQFRTNLGRVRAIFERTVHGRTLTPQERRIGGPMTPERAQSLRDEAQRAIDAGAPRGEVLRRLYQDFGLAPEKK